jgi:hypothetical protein
MQKSPAIPAHSASNVFGGLILVVVLLGLIEAGCGPPS